MQTMILNHYPPVIKQIREMQQIAKAEDIEFSKLNAAIDEVMRNMFVFTADETGVRRFEKLLGIKPKAEQVLDDRKIYILSVMNRRKMSLPELTAMLSNYSEGITALNDIAGMEMIVEINTDAGSLEMLNAIIDEILPMNIFFSFAMQRESVIRHRAEDLILMEFGRAASDTEYCNFGNSMAAEGETGCIQSVGGFYFAHEDNPVSGQAVCGAGCCLALQAPFETRESVIIIETAGSGAVTPVAACGGSAAIGADPPFEMQEGAEAAANGFMMCGADYAREEG